MKYGNVLEEFWHSIEVTKRLDYVVVQSHTYEAAQRESSEVTKQLSYVVAQQCNCSAAGLLGW